MGLECTDSLAVLDALTPEPGWETDLALFSSYSVDLVAVAAVVVALADEGDDHERLRDAPLARACERMRDRFRVVCQAGRVAVPKSGVSALVIADRWIREVRRDGNERSWHAKLALVRYRPIEAPDSEAEWRLWIGSRNLTRDTSWDSALTAVGRNSVASDSIDQSVAQAGRVLAARAALPRWSAADIEDQLLGLHWEWPEDMEVVSFDMWPDAQPAPRFPRAPRGLGHVVAVSPFVNGSIARKLSNWGRRSANRQLLTTPATLAALADQKRRSSLDGFTSLHQLDMSPGADGADADHQDETGDDQMVEVHRGLHAKLLWARSTAGDELWLGSANLTERAWNGRNTEAMVHAQVVPDVGEGLIDCLVNGLSTEVRHDDLLTARPGEEPAEKALDELRNRIAAIWDARLERDGASDTVRCETELALLRDNDGALLWARLLGQTEWVQWKPRATTVEFAATDLHRQTELVELELRSTEVPELTASWVARAVMDPPFDINRDRAVLARLMGPRPFLAWLRSLLDDTTGAGGGNPWPEPAPGSSRKTANWQHCVSGTPTLESVLRAWMRNPAAVHQVDRALETWAREIRESLPEDANEDDREALQEVDRFEAAWGVIREGLDLGATTP